MSDAIKQALRDLDPTKDELWTSNGLPRMDVLEATFGPELKRENVTAAAPDFTRTNRVIDGQDLEPFGGGGTQPPKDAETEETPVIAPLGGGGTQPPKTVAETVPDGSDANDDGAGEGNDDADPEGGGGTQPPKSEAEAEPVEEPDEKAELEKAVFQCTMDRAQVKAKMKALEDELAEIDKRETAYVEKLEALKPADTDQTAIQDYLKSQRELRLARAQRRSAALQALDPKDLAGKAPIDQAFSRKNQRGAQRPSRAPKG